MLSDSFPGPLAHKQTHRVKKLQKIASAVQFSLLSALAALFSDPPNPGVKRPPVDKRETQRAVKIRVCPRPKIHFCQIALGIGRKVSALSTIHLRLISIQGKFTDFINN